MPLQPPYLPPPGFPPERILFFGAAGAGKSKAAHSIAVRLAATGSRNKMTVVDTDYSWRRFLAAEGDPGNILIREAGDWESYARYIGEAQKQQPNDWVTIDHIGVAWEMAQDSYITRAYGRDPVDFLLEQKKTMKKSAGMGAALSGMGDWPFIKRMYRSAMNDLLYQSKLHVIGITTAEKIWESDAPDTLATYNQLGGKPGGEKHLDYGFHSVLQCGQNHAQKFWWISTAKDRGRPTFRREPMADFSELYLIGVCGWTEGAQPGPPPPPATVAHATTPLANALPVAVPVAPVPTPIPVPNGAPPVTETPAEKLARIKAMAAAAGG
jgi:hypothetical protein